MSIVVIVANIVSLVVMTATAAVIIQNVLENRRSNNKW